MNKFIGHIAIVATAMNRAAYNEYRGWDLPANENGLDLGQLVKYEATGHETWMLQSDFDLLFKPADTFLDRLEDEKAELDKKLEGLSTTLNVVSKPSFISDQQWIFMSRQQFNMRMYSQILENRISEAKGEPVPTWGKTEMIPTGSEDHRWTTATTTSQAAQNSFFSNR